VITVALTGATGFIGSILLKHRVDQGFQVKALYRPASNPRPTPSYSIELHDEHPDGYTWQEIASIATHLNGKSLTVFQSLG
jgi:uncharacterized protein YbjT (DUF2867 family)